MTRTIFAFKWTSQMNRVGSLAAGALFCCATIFAQAPNTGAMQQSAPTQNTSPNTMQNGSSGSMNQMQTANDASAGSAMADKMFIRNALEGNIAEIKTAQLALSRTSNDQVKQFAQRMIDDHTKMMNQVKPIAMQMGLSIPSEPSKKDKAEMARLQALSGDAFDQAYIKHMVKDHKKDDSDFKSEISSTQNAQVRQLAEIGDPIIESHLRMVQQIAQSMNISAGE